MAVPPVECRNVWKIFGQSATKIIDTVRSRNLSKEAVLEQFDCVIGVADASFSVQEGEIFCIMGLSGSGKSTLVRHINRLIEPTTGQVFVNGEDINEKNQKELRELRARKIGMVFQHMALLPHRSVRDNVAFALELRGIDKSLRRQTAQDTLKMVQLDGWEDRFPDELSGGMQQRVGLARAVAADPDILLMDEPFSALDPLIRRQLQDQFLDLSAKLKKTTVFITHDLDEAIRLGHHIAIMKDGRFVQIGTPEEIVTEPADDYVAEFVKGISRLKLVHAERIMVSLEEHKNQHAGSLLDFPRAFVDADLDSLINLSNTHDNSPIVIQSKDGQDVGVVTTKSLLRGMQAG